MKHDRKVTMLVFLACVAIAQGCAESILDKSESQYFNWVKSMHDTHKTVPGSFEEEILYATEIITLLDDYKSDNNEYPFTLDYIDIDNIPVPSLMRNPVDFHAWNRWLSYYRIMTDEFVLCIEEDYMMQHSSIIYTNSDRQWRESDCSIYRKQQKPETGIEERNAIVNNKSVFNRKLTRYTVELQNGETLEIIDKWPYFSIGDCVKIFFPENAPPRLATGDDCWEK